MQQQRPACADDWPPRVVRASGPRHVESRQSAESVERIDRGERVENSIGSSLVAHTIAIYVASVQEEESC